jgi:hypothetical protein
MASGSASELAFQLTVAEALGLGLKESREKVGTQVNRLGPVRRFVCEAILDPTEGLWPQHHRDRMGRTSATRRWMR